MRRDDVPNKKQAKLLDYCKSGKKLRGGDINCSSLQREKATSVRPAHGGELCPPNLEVDLKRPPGSGAILKIKIKNINETAIDQELPMYLIN